MSEDSEVRKPLWGGRYSKDPAKAAQDLGAHLGNDFRLRQYDVRASIAHTRALEDAGVVSSEDAGAIEKALTEIGEMKDLDVVGRADEDIHLAHESLLIEKLGDVGAKIHAARSRNDLVVTDFRLWLLEAGEEVSRLLVSLIGTLVARAQETAEMPVPGLTHNRPAQVVTMGYYLAAHAFALLRDVERLDQWAARTSVSPLGAGALATSTFGLDSSKTAKRLGFSAPFDNALDAVSDRDFAAEFAGVSSILAMHLSRLAADFARWSEPAYGYVELDQAYLTGSSMMPQKRNPDVLELVRAKAARFAGDLATLVTLAAGLPAGYHRDLQEDKEPAFDAAEELYRLLPALAGCISSATFDPEAMRRDSEDPDLFATDLAEALVKSGTPFRDAHRRVGELLKDLDARKETLRDVPDEEWQRLGLPGGEKLLDPDVSVRARDMPGGPAPDRVREQCDAMEAALESRIRSRQ